MTMERDFIGYGMHPPIVRWPDDARIAVQIAVNYEEGSEYSLLDGGPRREPTGDMTSPIASDRRDLINESFFEYGSRVGVWRLLDILGRHGVRANAICPGYLGTHMWLDVILAGARERGADTSEEFARVSAERVPLGRPQTPGDIGQAAVYLARADNVTGIALTVAGGLEVN